MKRNNYNILNEGRNNKAIRAVINPKQFTSAYNLWRKAEKNGDLGDSEKPKKSADLDTLIQIYVAFLLLNDLDCPTSIDELKNTDALPLYAAALISMNVDIDDITSLYVKGGGIIDGYVPQEKPSTNEPSLDYPAYDEVEVDEPTNEEPSLDYPAYDEVEDTEPAAEDIEPEVEEPEIKQPMPMHTPEKPDFNIVKNTTSSIFNKPTSSTLKYNKDFSEQETETYMNSIGKQLRGTNIDTTLYFNDNYGFNYNDGVTVAKVAISSSQTNDHMPRYIAAESIEVSLQNAGNNSVFDDFYYKEVPSSRGMKQILPGSNYYTNEISKGSFYTQILADNGCKPAVIISKYVPDAKLTKGLWYLPTLIELSIANNNGMLEKKKYWSSSVCNDGEGNIIYDAATCKVIETTNTSDKAFVVPFMKFK